MLRRFPRPERFARSAGFGRVRFINSDVRFAGGFFLQDVHVARGIGRDGVLSRFQTDSFFHFFDSVVFTVQFDLIELAFFANNRRGDHIQIVAGDRQAFNRVEPRFDEFFDFGAARREIVHLRPSTEEKVTAGVHRDTTMHFFGGFVLASRAPRPHFTNLAFIFIFVRMTHLRLEAIHSLLGRHIHIAFGARRGVIHRDTRTIAKSHRFKEPLRRSHSSDFAHFGAVGFILHHTLSVEPIRDGRHTAAGTRSGAHHLRNILIAQRTLEPDFEFVFSGRSDRHVTRTDRGEVFQRGLDHPVAGGSPAFGRDRHFTFRSTRSQT